MKACLETSETKFSSFMNQLARDHENRDGAAFATGT